MTTFIAFPDIHNKPEALKPFAARIAQADVVLLPGDMTNGNIGHLLRCFSVLDELTECVYAVPGNLDTAAMLAYLAREGINLHRRHIVEDGVVLAGCGGALPFAGRFVFSEAQLGQFLDESIADAPPELPLALVCHQPPHASGCDVLADGTPVGSHAVRAFIERVQPLVCFTGHIHEAVTVGQLGRTLILNPGPIWQSGQYAYAEIVDGQLLRAGIEGR